MRKSRYEFEMGRWLYKTFGGEIIIREERKDQLNPDYLWNGRFWDLKTISSEKAADAAVRKGIKQIRKNPGGIIIDGRSKGLNRGLLVSIIENRVRQKRYGSLDIIIIFDENAFEVWRYNKKAPHPESGQGQPFCQ